ncbi:uncharacterized protein ColSpa_05465 [Colletotrichum spaethianum]|uniref:Uncharacterized protein n=1 Tax=Colletotrichum spaethianum TaxID=700344 RepID=A0AA37LF48_9PEZI|nr:uncharacterized protein ColSpa_05465 [Colletotrichum spaethianum]GKT45284.1 hypothetical protein ColSpa_05465 [Colletotrichum spaethianum]
MRGLAQALLLAPALVGAAPSRIDMTKAQDASPSTFVTFNIPPGFNEDKPKPYTLRLEVLEAPSPCAYPNVKVNDNPLSLGGHTLGRGNFAGDHDGTAFIATWSTTCAGDEQLLRFTLESLAGRTLASDLAFVARFRQTAPAAILEIAGNVQVSEQRPAVPSKDLPQFDRHDPRPGDDEDGLLEDPPFPPPPHHHVGNHPDNHPGEHHGEHHHEEHRPHKPGRPASPEEDEHVLAELRELDCLRHQLHALKHAIHMKESRLAQDHGVFVSHRGHRAFKECDSVKCVIETFMHRVAGGFRGKGRGHHGGPGRDHHGPPPSCPGFPFPEHGHHGKGNHTLPPPPPPPGFCHCAPPPPEGPPDGPPEGPPEPPKNPPHHGHHEGPPPPPFHEPHRGPPGHHGPPLLPLTSRITGPPHPPPPPPFDEPFHGPPHHPEGPHHGGPPGFPPEGPPPDFEAEHPLDVDGSEHRPHPHGPPGHGIPPPHPPPPGFHGHHGPHGRGLPLPVKITLATLLLVGVVALVHAVISRFSSRREARRERKHSRRTRHRRDHREVRKEAFKASLADVWSRMFADRIPADAEDEEKRAFLSGAAARPRPSTSSDEGDFETMESMSSEITQFRNAATLVTEMVAAEERRQRMREQEQQQRLQMPMRHAHPRGPAVATPPSPTAAFAEYMGDDVLPAYDEHAPSVVVSDGFSSYSPGSTEYVPGASSDTASNIDSVLGDSKN